MTPKSNLPESDYTTFLEGLKTRIKTAQVKAALAVNRELIELYWQIGRDILEKQEVEGWGSKVIDRLSKDLRKEFPNIKGFSPRNLKYMRAFAETYREQEFVQQAAAQIPWFHNCTLLDKVKDPIQRQWYIQKTIENGWSRAVLITQIDTGLYHRLGGAVTNFDSTLPAPQSDLAQSLLKSEYNLEFLTIQEKMHERELEKALVLHIQKFLLELGVGFAFMGNQYRIEVEGDEFYIDLLFFHVHLRCYVVIELKTTEFKPEYSGQINFYVNVVDDRLRHPDDHPTIGLLLCRSQKKPIVHYALKGINQPIGVSTYELGNALPEAIQESLPSIEQLEMEIESAVREFEDSVED